MIAAILVTIIVTIPISILWATAIDRMHNDPDYKGDDFLDFD